MQEKSHNEMVQFKSLMQWLILMVFYTNALGQVLQDIWLSLPFVTHSGKRSNLSHGSDMCDDSLLVHSTIVDTKQMKLI
jgi:hypothetical protein